MLWSRRVAALRCLGAAGCSPWWSRGACSAALLAELGNAVGEDTGRLSTAASVCDAHGKDESYHAAIGPDAVVFPISTAEVSQVCTTACTITCQSMHLLSRSAAITLMVSEGLSPMLLSRWP